MRVMKLGLLAGVGIAALTTAGGAHAQATSGETSDGTGIFGVEEIVVTARRRDERLVDVPVSVNAVTSEDLAKLNLRQFEDIENVVPGLSLNYALDGTGAAAAIRGVKMDVAASGYNGTVEFYLNDTPIIAEALFPLMYDVGQIEVLRGPQGTLRGRASPSGSITVTTRRPDLNDFGGTVSATATHFGGVNGNAALNLPIVEGKLAMRFAGAYDENPYDHVERVFGGPDPYRHVKSGRASLRYEPTDTLAFDITYQALTQKIRAYYQYESASIVDPTQPASPVFIEADDRYGLADLPIRQRIEYDNLNYRAQWSFAGQRLNYAGAYNKRVAKAVSPIDDANFLDDNAPANVQNLSGPLDSRSTTRAHELRLSSEERVFGMFDYIVGAFYQDTDSPTDIQRTTPVFIGPISPTVTALVVTTPIRRTGKTKEKSGFANLTWHLGDKTEISGGVRYIDYKSDAALLINGVLQDAATENYEDDTWIYTASIKHNFHDDLMVYASAGTSWRPGISAVGDFSLDKSERENSFLVLPPEESESYEIGFKASALDRRLQTSFAIFHQKFDNYPYRSSGGVFFKETAAGVPEPRVNSFNFVAAVPVEVNGVEGQVSFAATPQWDIAATAAYAKGKIKDGLIPCNDYFPHDGVPDSGSQVPTVEQIEQLTGDNLAACVVSYRSANAPLFSGNVQSEYRIPVASSTDAFVRGLLTYYGKSQNDPANAVDDVSDYALLNLYLGFRDREGAWEVTLYGKNITNTERVLRRDSTPATLPYSRVDIVDGNIIRSSPTGITTYRRVSFTEPREFGVNVRYAFGSR